MRVPHNASAASNGSNLGQSRHLNKSNRDPLYMGAYDGSDSDDGSGSFADESMYSTSLSSATSGYAASICSGSPSLRRKPSGRDKILRHVLESSNHSRSDGMDSSSHSKRSIRSLCLPPPVKLDEGSDEFFSQSMHLPNPKSLAFLHSSSKKKKTWTMGYKSVDGDGNVSVCDLSHDGTSVCEGHGSEDDDDSECWASGSPKQKMI